MKEHIQYNEEGNTTAIIFYHKDDNDGVFSAALIRAYLSKHTKFDFIIERGVDYSSVKAAFNTKHALNNICDQYDYIFMTDISCPANIMKDIYEHKGDHFIWIDHHAPIINECEGINIDGLRDINHSAIYNAYRFMYDTDIPELFKVLSAYDSFTFEKEGYEFDYVYAIDRGATATYNLDFENIFNLLYRHENLITDKEFIEQLYNKGKAIIDEDDRRNAALIKLNGEHWTVAGRPAIMVVTSGQTGSMLFDSVKTIYHNGIVLKKNRNGWSLHLYNTNNDDHSFHCGDYLKKKFNGGGHEGAAGCHLTTLQAFWLFLKKKI